MTPIYVPLKPSDCDYPAQSTSWELNYTAAVEHNRKKCNHIQADTRLAHNLSLSATLRIGNPPSRRCEGCSEARPFLTPSLSIP